MACLIVGPLWMWAYHENVPIAVTAWHAASVAYDTVVSFSKEAASDATTAISEEIRSTPRRTGDIASNKLTEIRGRKPP